MKHEYQSLVSRFDTICSNDGDREAFISFRNDGSTSQIGFTELRESSVAIARELLHRHSVCSQRLLKSDAPSYSCSPPSVLIVSNYPSAGEAAAVLACTRLRLPFVPVDLVGPNRIGMRRFRNLIDDVGSKIAIVVVDDTTDASESAKIVHEEEEDDFMISPALKTTVDAHLDQHPSVKLLEKGGIFRHVMISCRDGTLLNGLGLSDLDLPTPIVEETEESLRDPLYIIYTSGSTSTGDGDKDIQITGRRQQTMGKAVQQCHGGLINRVTWYYDTFPFVQQLRKDIGFAETNKLLDADGIDPLDDVVVRRTPLSFVDSICETFATLLAGVPLYIPSAELIEKEGLAGIVDEAERACATRISCLPSQLMQILRYGNMDGGWSWKSLNLAIVSGEPCLASLPSLWERTLYDDASISSSKLLVNLYGQSETSADILCAVVSTGGRTCSRYHRAESYAYLNEDKTARTAGDWAAELPSGVDKSLASCLKWTVPCGKPIHHHTISIGHPSTASGPKSQLGNLYVKGPGLALGYLNRKKETLKHFQMFQGERWFDTNDLAYFDNESELYYILGRNDFCRKDHQGEEVTLPSTKAFAVVGKINGVLVHTAEVETVYASALAAVLRHKTKQDANKKFEGGLGVVAVIHDAISGLLVGAEHTSGNNDAIQKARRLTLFVNFSSLPPDSKKNVRFDTCTSRLVDPSQGLEENFQDSLSETKLMLLGRSKKSLDLDDYVCHPALVPHTIHLVSNFPTSGAAAKIDRFELLRLVKSERLTNEQHGVHRSIGEVQSVVQTIYCGALCLDVSSCLDQSFAELGGDSMMAISIAHNITVATAETPNTTRATAADVLNHSVREVCDIILGNLISRKSETGRDNASGEITVHGSLNALGPNRTVNERPSPSNQVIDIAWKCPLLMCVDASPLLVSHPAVGNVVLAASQGGDIVCCRASSGEVLDRRVISGKVEGSMRSFDIAGRTLIYVCAYTTSSNSTGNVGRVYAFELSRKRKHECEDGTGTLTLLWERQVPAQVKGAPTPFEIKSSESLKNEQDCSMSAGVLVGCYDGILRYFDAVTGEEIATIGDLGGAIHASPCTFTQQSSRCTCALVTSSTWTGRLTCVKLLPNTLSRLWYVDLWAPIYASPTIGSNGKSLVAFFGAVDGAVRCVDLESGKELWKASTAHNKPIFSACTLIGKGASSAVVVGSHDGSVYCLLQESGKIVWVSEGGTGSAILGTPVLLGSSSILVASTSGSVACLASSDGSVLKSIESSIAGEIFSSPVVHKDESSGGLCAFLGARDSHLYKLWV